MGADGNTALAAFYGGRRILITGGASFLGSHLAERLVAAGGEVTVADDLSSGRLANLDAVRGAIRFLQGDLRDGAFARQAGAGQEVVFHLAAAHGGRGYIETHPVQCLGNMGLDHTVFAACVAGGARRIVYASSACVYPTPLQDREDARNLLAEADAGFAGPGTACADSEYGWAKLMGELQLRAFCRQHDVHGVACRIFTSYGERENETHAVMASIAKAVARLDPYPVWGSGRQTRNFTYVEDTVTGLALAGARLSGFETINIGTATHHTLLELLEEIFRCLGWRPAEIAPQLHRPVGVKSRAADCRKCDALLGWRPRISLGEGVRRTVSWYVRERGAALADLDRRLMER